MRAQVHGMGMANAQISAAIPNNDYYEQLVFSTEHIKSLKTQRDLPIIAGAISVPGRPGLGFEVDWSAVAKSALAIV